MEANSARYAANRWVNLAEQGWVNSGERHRGYPISEGHTLVVPRLHVASLFDLPPAEIAAVWEFVSRVRGELAKRFRVESFTIGLNDGRSAGQTVMHAHVHVVPRREGDVPDPRGGIRWVIQGKADYWTRSP